MMYPLKVLPELRYVSRNHQILRQLHCGALYLRNPIKASAPCNRELLLHAEQRTFLKSYISQIQPYASGRWFSSQPVSTEDGVLIYTGNLGKAVLGVKFFSYSSSVFSLCLMPFILTKTGIGASGLALQAAFCGVIGFFTFLTPLLLHFVTKGYVVRLYHNGETDTYTAVTYSVLLVEKKTVFRQSEVTIPDVSRMFTSFYANGRSMLVNPDQFELPRDYNHLMGYDRPFSFDAEDVQKPDKS